MFHQPVILAPVLILGFLLALWDYFWFVSILSSMTSCMSICNEQIQSKLICSYEEVQFIFSLSGSHHEYFLVIRPSETLGIFQFKNKIKVELRLLEKQCKCPQISVFHCHHNYFPTSVFCTSSLLSLCACIFLSSSSFLVAVVIA